MKQKSDDIIIHPSKGKREKGIPSKGLFFVNPFESRVAMHLLLQAGGEQRFLFHSGLVVSATDDFFVAGPALGAPMAAMTLEKLIVLGATSVIMCGWCGALDKELKVGDSFFGGTAYSGEGTSKYYSNKKSVEPSPSLVRRLQTGLTEKGVSGSVWSTDAPYRESRALLDSLVKEYTIAAVDMEYSALCNVAVFREIDFAALFLVSDELWNTNWKPGFTGKAFKKKSQFLVQRLIELAAT